MHTQFLPDTPEKRRWHLAEECAEVIKNLSKAERFSLDGDDHYRHCEVCQAKGTPRQRILNELVDLEHAIDAVRKDLTGG
jgi:hypothetical protein